jgi:hypothetical protein
VEFQENEENCEGMMGQCWGRFRHGAAVPCLTDLHGHFLHQNPELVRILHHDLRGQLAALTHDGNEQACRCDGATHESGRNEPVLYGVREVHLRITAARLNMAVLRQTTEYGHGFVQISFHAPHPN